MCRQVSHIFDLLLQLFGQLVKEGIRVTHFLSQVLLVAPDVPEDFDTKLGEVVLEAHKIALHVLILVLVRFEVQILLLADLLAKVYLLESVRNLLGKRIILLGLLRNVMCASFCLQPVDQLDVDFKLIVADLESLDFLFEQTNLFICLILPASKLAVLKSFIEQPLVSSDRNQPRHHNCLLQLLLIGLKSSLSFC